MKNRVTVERDTLEEYMRRVKDYISQPTRKHAQALRQVQRTLKGEMQDSDLQRDTSAGEGINN